MLLFVTLIAFALVNLAPGDPVTAMINPATRGELGPEWVEERKKALGLDRPMIYRYGIWLKELLSGNLGYSLVGGQPVAEQIGARIGPTLLLMVSAITLGTVIGIPLGVYSALRPNSWTDYLLTIFGFLAISTPVFFLGLASMYVFAVNLKWLPTSGMRTLGIPASTTDLIKHMIMPVSVLALVHIPLVMRYTRASMIESFRQDYVTTARAKGLRERAVVIWHAFRNALIPLITIIGLSLPELLSGAVITETIFQWPGMGLLAMRAVNARDYPLVLGVILVTACMVLISNLIADLCYAVADPRIRYR
ncbi:MAG: ABC transporter permease [Thermomicrobiales bacterium]|nr:ABC transporter permease [Thermomicrobiales bacterium]